MPTRATCSVLVVFHHLDGLLRATVPSVLQLGAGQGSLRFNSRASWSTANRARNRDGLSRSATPLEEPSSSAGDNPSPGVGTPLVVTPRTPAFCSTPKSPTESGTRPPLPSHPRHFGRGLCERDLTCRSKRSKGYRGESAGFVAHPRVRLGDAEPVVLTVLRRARFGFDRERRNLASRVIVTPKSSF